ncbi:MAG: LysR family transcriptional regulator [Rhodocyclaceae bacterium]|jgi:DNA-binding transcriptional LysR family regulator|uniref:LysR family transcriptional regulator n=1 Tax=Candidatus Desulfobacillus denitrificans TaxID=2608985 RepID=A0A809R7F7_9PROT|nr:LysR family transcriptional regulator [Rhodocyclaceae bacterium]BBO20275.1 LysR family transcriptional regulator [Candidatus Desulfobacillus denitrificans]GIK44653.1 MAG: LysR family transcriptional regulator [Betaproteobacteria bacterium]GJQ54896.1 MAG: LysR family transcriptional regulator [Rhodocyclaceae bacterium]
MSRLKQIETFVSVASRGSLSAAAAAEGVAPGVVSRRLDALEARLGVKLLLRTTRRVTLTFEGSAYLEDCQRILRELGDAEASVSLGGVKARGHLRLSAPAGFGRRHVAPLVMQFLDANPEVTVNLDLSDRLVDLVNEGIDCAVRVGELTDSSLVSIRLAENPRVVVASPAYLDKHGTPRALADLANHNCLSLGQQRGWLFRDGGEIVSIKVSGQLECNDGAVLHEWALAGRGLAWRSMWEVGEDLRRGALLSVLGEFAAPPTGIYAVFPQRKYLPLRVRLLVDHLKHSYGSPDYWAAPSYRD